MSTSISINPSVFDGAADGNRSLVALWRSGMLTGASLREHTGNAALAAVVLRESVSEEERAPFVAACRTASENVLNALKGETRWAKCDIDAWSPLARCLNALADNPSATASELEFAKW